MARNEKKSEYSRLTLRLKPKAQSAVEYTLVFPILFFMILGIMELGFMWHSYNTLQFATQNVSENLASVNCGDIAAVRSVLEDKSAIIYGKMLDTEVSATEFTSSNQSAVFTIKSKQKTKDNKNLLTAKVTCHSGYGGGSRARFLTLQMQSIYILHFFSASLPNFATGERIVIIPANIELVSTKSSVLKRF